MIQLSASIMKYKHFPPHNIRLFLCSEIKIWVPEPDNSELPALWWDAVCDKCLLLGVFKHGNKPLLVFLN